MKLPKIVFITVSSKGEKICSLNSVKHALKLSYVIFYTDIVFKWLNVNSIWNSFLLLLF